MDRAHRVLGAMSMFPGQVTVPKWTDALKESNVFIVVVSSSKRCDPKRFVAGHGEFPVCHQFIAMNVNYFRLNAVFTRVILPRFAQNLKLIVEESSRLGVGSHVATWQKPIRIPNEPCWSFRFVARRLQR